MEGSMEGDVKICATTLPDVAPICRNRPPLRRISSHEDFLRWMQAGRHARGNIGREWSRCGKVVPRHGRRSCELVNSFNDAFDGVQRSPMTDVKIQDLVSRVIHRQCGFQGCRVGEAPLVRPNTVKDGKHCACHISVHGHHRGRSRTGPHRDSAFDPWCSASGAPTVVANRFSSLAAESDDELEGVVPPTVPAMRCWREAPYPSSISDSNRSRK